MSVSTNLNPKKVGKLKDFCDVGDGAHASIKRRDSGIMYLTSKNFKPSGLDLTKVDFIDQNDYAKHFGPSKKALKKPQGGDVLFGIIGSLGIPYVVKDDDLFGISSSVAILRPREGLEAKYLYYFMTSSFFQESVNAIKSGVAQSFLSLKMIRNLPLIMFGDQEQKKIAAILSAYDDLIETNNKRIALLEKAAAEIYREWFVRLRFPGWETAVFHKGIPEDWKQVSLEGLCKVARGSSPRPIKDTKYFSDGTIPWIKIADATASRMFIYETKQYVNDLGASYSRKLPKGSLIIATSGTLGFCILLGVEGCVHDGWMYLSEYQGNIKPTFMYYVINSYRDYLNNLSYGAAIQNINTGIMRRLSITVPSDTILTKFYSVIEPIHDNIFSLGHINRNLIKTRDLLLSRLISGKLPVDNLNIQFPPSMTPAQESAHA